MNTPRAWKCGHDAMPGCSACLGAAEAANIGYRDEVGRLNAEVRTLRSELERLRSFLARRGIEVPEPPSTTSYRERDGGPSIPTGRVGTPRR